MANVVSSFYAERNTMPVVWVRYNPHAHKVDGVTRRVTSEERQAGLVKFLRELSFDQAPPVRVYYLYYDTQDGEPCVLSEDEYQPSVRDWYAGCL